MSLSLSGFSHGQEKKVGSGRLHGRKKLPIHGQYKYLVLCLFISVLEAKYVQSPNAFCLLQLKRCVTKSHSIKNSEFVSVLFQLILE